jgi:hypothetical protein
MSTLGIVVIGSFSRDENWFFLLFGVICLIGGLRAVVTRKARTRSRGGHVSHYAGKEAVIRGAIGILIGAAAIAFSAVNLI